MALWIVLALVVLLALFVVVAYNRLVGMRNRSENAWSQVDVQLRRRYDLIPNLVEAVKGYAAHERTVFDEVTQARAAAQSAGGPAAQGRAEAGLSGAIGRLMAVAEQYPELRATENFQQLQSELAETENRIAVSRQVYNDTVLTYDNARRAGADQHRRDALPLPVPRVLRARRRRRRPRAGRSPSVRRRRGPLLAAACAALAVCAAPAAAQQDKSFSLHSPTSTSTCARTARCR